MPSDPLFSRFPGKKLDGTWDDLTTTHVEYDYTSLSFVFQKKLCQGARRRLLKKPHVRHMVQQEHVALTSYGLIEYDCHISWVERRVVIFTVCVGTSNKEPTVKIREIFILIPGQAKSHISAPTSSSRDHWVLHGIIELDCTDKNLTSLPHNKTTMGATASR